MKVFHYSGKHCSFHLLGKYVLGVSRSLKMANAMFAETLKKLPTRCGSFAESRSCTLHSSRETLRIIIALLLIQRIMHNKDSPVIPLQFSESRGFARRLSIKASLWGQTTNADCGHIKYLHHDTAGGGGGIDYRQQYRGNTLHSATCWRESSFRGPGETITLTCSSHSWGYMNLILTQTAREK
jgi:hypothetical protein